MGQQAKYLYEFGPFRLIPAEQQLLRAGQAIPLTPKAFETLVALVESSGHVMDKDELLRRVWPDTFVEEATLAKNVSTLRKALGESAEDSTYIETVAKRGYRFVAAVRVATETASSAVSGDVAARPRSQQWLWVAVLLLAALVIGGYWAWQKAPAATAVPTGRITLVVLPFENLTGDTEQEYLSDGLTEEIITQLGRMYPERLGVIARTSAMQYKQTKKSTAQIGRELGVDYLLEGSVRREGGRVRISAQLIQVRDQTHLWAENYDRDIRDVLALQSAVAQVIARQIEINLTPEQQARLARSRTVNPKAYEAYLKGRYFWNKRTGEGHQKAIEYFQGALESDPAYAQAYAGLADAYALQSEGYGMPRAEGMAKARAAALKALELDDALAEAHASLAFVRMHYDWDWPGAEKEFRRAIELNAGYGTAHHWYAYCLLATGRSEEALQEMRRAEESDPLSVIIKTDVAEMLYFGRRYDEAIAQARKALEMDPDFVFAHRVHGWALVQKARYAEAIAEFQEQLRRDPGGSAHLLSSLSYAYVRAGRASDARRALAQLKDTGSAGFDIGVHAALGEKDAAFASLETVFEQRSGFVVFLRTSPEFDPLRSDPRFQALLRRAGLR